MQAAGPGAPGSSIRSRSVPVSKRPKPTSPTPKEDAKCKGMKFVDINDAKKKFEEMLHSEGEVKQVLKALGEVVLKFMDMFKDAIEVTNRQGTEMEEMMDTMSSLKYDAINERIKKAGR